MLLSEDESTVRRRPGAVLIYPEDQEAFVSPQPLLVLSLLTLHAPKLGDINYLYGVFGSAAPYTLTHAQAETHATAPRLLHQGHIVFLPPFPSPYARRLSREHYHYDNYTHDSV
ncbi:hypothetical protein E2C01_064108 [Portunus trituberculatus]|uniref:Uncharacterized protein n=1 Tax=Portunus trituberculatus TaxID=210409 RepID=A0A5B7HIV2_PORTR|nr:hypothetical protein [Portunus trituberculatus]